MLTVKMKLCTTELFKISKLRGTKGKHYYLFSKWLVETSSSLIFIDRFI